MRSTWRLHFQKTGSVYLLINCDLHGPTEAGSPQEPLKGQGRNALAARTLPGIIVTPVPGLHVMPACSRAIDDPISYLRSPEFAELIVTARREYDLVLCDTPPVLSVPDPLLVARVSDAVLLVSEYGNGANQAMSDEDRVKSLSPAAQSAVWWSRKVTSDDMGFTCYMGYGRRRRARSMLGALASSELR